MINNKVTLVDVSFWQDDDYTPYKIDFSIMKSKGIDGVILRAGQNTWLDEDFRDYVGNADRANIPWGAYWFYDSRSNPEYQAYLVTEALKGLPEPRLGIWGDFEERYGGPWGGGAHFRVFMEQLRIRFPNTLLGVYTGPFYFATNVKTEQKFWFKQFPLWIAHYGVENPSIPYPWETHAIWQYTDQGDGKAMGAESNELDMNLFRGTFDDYKKFFLLGDIEPIEGGDTPMPENVLYTMDLKAGLTANVRNVANGSNVVGTITGPVRVQIVNEGVVAGSYTWYQIISPVLGWVAKTSQYENFQAVPQEPTDPTLLYTIEFYSDGRLMINGNPYTQT